MWRIAGRLQLLWWRWEKARYDVLLWIVESAWAVAVIGYIFVVLALLDGLRGS